MPPYCTSCPRLGDITTVAEFGVADGTGQYAKDKWVRVGICFAKAKNLVQDTVRGGQERERCVRWVTGNLRDWEKLSSQDSVSCSSRCVRFSNSSRSCLNDMDRPSEPDRSSLKKPSLLCPWGRTAESSLSLH